MLLTKYGTSSKTKKLIDRNKDLQTKRHIERLCVITSYRKLVRHHIEPISIAAGVSKFLLIEVLTKPNKLNKEQNRQRRKGFGYYSQHRCDLEMPTRNLKVSIKAVWICSA